MTGSSFMVLIIVYSLCIIGLICILGGYSCCRCCGVIRAIFTVFKGGELTAAQINHLHFFMVEFL